MCLLCVFVLETAFRKVNIFVSALLVHSVCDIYSVVLLGILSFTHPHVDPNLGKWSDTLLFAVTLTRLILDYWRNSILLPVRLKGKFMGHRYLCNTQRFWPGHCIKWISTHMGCLSIGVAVVLDALHGGYKLHYSRHAGQ